MPPKRPDFRRPAGPGGGPEIRINHRIRAAKVRVIGADGTQLGIMELKRALELAEAAGLDLAEVAPQSTPPVCKILDFGKYKYEIKKKQKGSKKNQAVSVLKEIQFRPHTDKHDIEFKTRHIQRFLGEGHKVKVTVRFRGREAAHADIGFALLNQIVDMIGASGTVEQPPRMEGRMLHMVFAPVGKSRVEKVKPRELTPAAAETKSAPGAT